MISIPLSDFDDQWRWRHEIKVYLKEAKKTKIQRPTTHERPQPVINTHASPFLLSKKKKVVAKHSDEFTKAKNSDLIYRLIVSFQFNISIIEDRFLSLCCRIITCAMAGSDALVLFYFFSFFFDWASSLSRTFKSTNRPNSLPSDDYDLSQTPYWCTKVCARR